MMATGLQQLPVGASLDTEAAEQRMRADMWFRRSGELLHELTNERQAAATATALAATARAQASAASQEATGLRERCEALARELGGLRALASTVGANAPLSSSSGDDSMIRRADADAAAERLEAKVRAEEQAAMREELLSAREELEAERTERRRAEEAATRHQQRVDSLRQQVDHLSEQLETREREHHEMAALLGAVRSCEQLELASASSPRPASAASGGHRVSVSPQVTANLGGSGGGGRSGGSIEPVLEVSPEFVAEIPPAAREPPAPRTTVSFSSPVALPASRPPNRAATLSRAGLAGSGQADAAGEGPSRVAKLPPSAASSVALPSAQELSELVRGVLGGELSSLVAQLRDAAVGQAEKACDARVAVLETAVGELLGAMDAETHRLLLKWRGQLEATLRENRVLKEQQRVHHVAQLDLKNQLHAERRKAGEAQAAAAAAQKAVPPPPAAAAPPAPSTAARQPGPGVAYWYPNAPQPIALQAQQRGAGGAAATTTRTGASAGPVPVGYWVW